MRRSALTALGRACDGSMVVEFALVFPLFLMLVFGTIEYGRLLWTMQALQETAVAGARCMALTQSTCNPGGTYSQTNTISYIQGVARGWGLSLPSTNISPNNNTSCNGNGTNFSMITLTTTFTSVVPQIVLLAAGGTSLSATACYPNAP